MSLLQVCHTFTLCSIVPHIWLARPPSNSLSPLRIKHLPDVGSPRALGEDRGGSYVRSHRGNCLSLERLRGVNLGRLGDGGVHYGGKGLGGRCWHRFLCCCCCWLFRPWCCNFGSFAVGGFWHNFNLCCFIRWLWGCASCAGDGNWWRLRGRRICNWNGIV